MSEISREEAIKDIKENVLPCVGGKSLIMAISDMEKLEKIEEVISTMENTDDETIESFAFREIEQIVKSE